MKVKGLMYELSIKEAVDDIEERRAAKVIEDEIRTTFNNGLAKKCDPHQLEEALYRKHPSEFKRLSAGGRFFLDEASIRRVKIKVALVNTGRLKGR